MFAVGDKVIHRVYGAGVITARKEMQITETSNCYFVIQMIGSPSTLLVPTDHAEQKLRPVSRKASLRNLLVQELASAPDKLPADYKERAERVKSKLSSGEAKKWVQVVRNLTYRQQQGSLSSVDRKLLERAMHLLTEELALVLGIDQGEAEARLVSIVKGVTDDDETVDDALVAASTSEADEKPGQEVAAQRERQGLLDSLRHYTAQALGLGTK